MRQVSLRLCAHWIRRNVLGIFLLLSLTLVLVALAAKNHTRHREAPLAIEPTTGDEIVLVFIGSSTCGWSKLPELPAAFSKIRAAVQEATTQDGKTFVAVGVAPDISVDAGIDFLSRFGPFHEVLVGRSWLNRGALEYVWQTHPGPAATPQLVLLSRELSVDSVPGGSVPSISAEKVIKRWVGAPAMLEAVSADYRKLIGGEQP